MLNISAQPIYLYSGAVDMRRSFHGLSAMAEAAFPEKLLTGALFVFVNRRRNMVKLMYWDNDGMAIWYKRLEKGTFRVSPDGRTDLNRREFMLLLEGVTPRRMNRRFNLADKFALSN